MLNGWTDCNTCGESFLPRKGAPGLKGQCLRCGRREERKREVIKTLGLVGGAGVNKSNAIGIFREPSRAMAAEIRRQNGGRYGMNLQIGSPVAEQLRQGRKEEEER